MPNNLGFNVNDHTIRRDYIFNIRKPVNDGAASREIFVNVSFLFIQPTRYGRKVSHIRRRKVCKYAWNCEFDPRWFLHTITTSNLKTNRKKYSWNDNPVLNRTSIRETKRLRELIGHEMLLISLWIVGNIKKILKRTHIQIIMTRTSNYILHSRNSVNAKKITCKRTFLETSLFYKKIFRNNHIAINVARGLNHKKKYL